MPSGRKGAVRWNGAGAFGLELNARRIIREERTGGRTAACALFCIEVVKIGAARR